MKANDKLGALRRWFGPQRVLKQLPFIYFIGFLTLVYISNVHRAEKKVRYIHQLQKEVVENQSEYWSTMSEVQCEGLRSKTEKRVEDLGLNSPKVAPKVIVVKDEK